MTNDHEPRSFPFPTDRLDLNPIYAKLRADEPMSRVVLPYGGPAWFATRDADVRAVLADPRLSRAATTSLIPAALASGFQQQGD